MKCINMNIVVILFFISIKSLTIGGNKTNGMNEEIFSQIKSEGKDCPDLLSVIQHNNLSSYTINCEAINARSLKDVMQHACFVVKNMFKVVCNKEFNQIQLNLLGRDNTTNICPMDFSHLHALGLDFVFKSHELVKTLASKDDCEKICYEVYSTRIQCVLLSKFNNYLKTRNPLPHSDPVKFPPTPQLAGSAFHKTAQTAPAQPAKVEHLPLARNEAKNGTAKPSTGAVASQMAAAKSNSIETSKKEKKIGEPKQATTPKEEMQSTKKTETAQLEVKLPEIESDKTVSKSNDKVAEVEFSNEEDFQKGNDPLLESGILNESPDPQKMQSLEDKGSSFLTEKSSYIGEGFSQAEDSHFFFYFIMMSSVVIIGYLAFHNKNKILAYALEGSSGRRSRRRPNPARYRKLETNLEEVISSSATNATTSNVVY